MTTKTVAVQLIALTSQYQKAMGAATASTAKLQATSGAASKSIGSVLGPSAVIAGAVVAGAAVKMALDWDTAFTQISAITDTSQAQVAQWKDQVLALSGETAQAPQDLADALYFLASAGLDANQIMPTLEMSAKAAAVGLGETADIARLTANVLNAYSKSGITATQVTDTLVAAVREGTAEPDEFADALGRILPIASKAGISFDQVAASLASLSNIGLDVNEGVTAMRGVIQTLLAPTMKAKEALKGMGISTDELRASLVENGLIATLRMLDDAAGGNIDTMNAIIGNVRALTGAFGLTQQEAAKVDEIFRDVMESSGAMGDSFDKTAKSDSFKLKQALVDLQTVMLELGQTLLPAVVQGLQVLAQGAENASVKLRALADAYMAVADALGSALVPGEKARQNFIATREALIQGKISVDQYRDVVTRMGEAGLITSGHMAELLRLVDHMRGGTKQGSTEADRYRGELLGIGEAADGAVPPLGELGGAVKKTATDLDRAERAANNFSDALDELTQVAFDVEEARLNWHQGLIDLRKELRDGTRTLDINSEAGIANREALKGQLENALELGIALRKKGASETEAAKATRDHVAQVRAEAIAAGFSKGQVDAYIRVLKLTPKQISTIIKAQTATAEAALIRVRRLVDDIPGIKDVLVRYRSTGGGPAGQIGHAGGVVGSLPRYHGGGDVKSDEQLVLARKGEHILTPRQYASLTSAHGSPQGSGTTKVVVINRISPRLDRRRFTDETDHDATYSGRWS